MPEVFGLIWVIAVIVFIANAVKKAGGGQQRSGSSPSANRNVPRQLNPQAQRPQVYDAQQESMDRASKPAGGKQTFRQVPGSTYGSSSTGSKRSSSGGKGQQFGSGQSFSEVSRAYSLGQTKASRLAETGVLLEDRKNDWLAKQLREEAYILRHGGLYDLGAMHEVNCDARSIKREHERTHNSNGLDKRTFR